MWRTVKLGDILKTGAGGTPRKSKKEFYEGGDIKWLLSGAVCERDIYDSKTYITQAGLENSSAKVFPKNTVLIAMYGATAGQVGILRTEAATNQAVCGIYPSNDYLPEFLYYYLTNYKETLLLEVSGVAQPNLSQVKIKNIPIPFIALEEQQRIVEKLDAAFAEIDRAIEVASFRQKNLVNLFAEILSNKLNLSGYEKVKLRQVAKVVGGNGFPQKFQGKEDGEFPFYKVSDMNLVGNEVAMDVSNNSVNVSDLKSMKAKTHPAGTVIFPKIGGAISTNKKRILSKPSAFDNNVMGVIPSDKILPEYLYKLFLNIDLYELSNKAALPSITAGTVNDLNITLPVLEVQQRIVDELDFISLQTDLAETAISAVSENYTALKSAILAQELQPSEAA